MLLSLSQNQVSVIECQPCAIHEIRPKNIPGSLEEALQYEDPEKQLQCHTETSGATNRPVGFPALQTFLKGGKAYVHNRGEFSGMPDCAAVFRY